MNTNSNSESMSLVFILNFSGIFSNLIGTIILAISLSKYLTAMHGAIAIHDMTIKGITGPSHEILVAEGIDILLKKGVNNGKKRTRIGLISIALGFILQLIPYILSILNNKYN